MALTHVTIESTKLGQSWVERDNSATCHRNPHPPHRWHKSKPEDRQKAAAELKKEARAGNRAAVDTMKKAPRKWARD